MREVTLSEMEDMKYSNGYANYIMEHGDLSARVICKIDALEMEDGDDLTLAMEDGYLFEEYAESIGVILG
jgi:predicted transcriptional regulator